jgi:hypothetical protein
VLHHLLARLILFVFHAHRRMLTRPCFSAPVVGRQLIRRAFDAARTSTIGLLPCGLALLYRHVGVAKTYHPRFTIGTGADNALLSAAYIASWAVAG